MPIQEIRLAVPQHLGSRSMDIANEMAALEKSLMLGEIGAPQRLDDALTHVADSLMEIEVFPQVFVSLVGERGHLSLLPIGEHDGSFFFLAQEGSLIRASLLEDDAVDLDNCEIANEEHKKRLTLKTVELSRGVIANAYLKRALEKASKP